MSALQRFLPNRYVWIVATSFWLVVHSLVTYIQLKAFSLAGTESSWWYVWYILSPWFLNWIWMTIIIFSWVKWLGGSQLTKLSLIALHLVFGVLFILLYWSVVVGLLGWMGLAAYESFTTGLMRILTRSAHVDVLIYSGVLALAIGLRFYHNSMLERLEIKRLQAALVGEQLKLLRTQLNPHFLFNALNTVASLVRLKREKEAIKALSSMSAMLRKILEHKGDDEVPIKEEVTFLNNYLAIQKLRFDDKLDPSITVEANCLELEIPNMLLHPLVENAVQHGSQAESLMNPLRLNISRSEDMLKISLINKFAKHTQSGFGIGVSNTRKRLEKLYDHFVLDLHQLDSELFETILEIPLRQKYA